MPVYGMNVHVHTLSCHVCMYNVHTCTYMYIHSIYDVYRCSCLLLISDYSYQLLYIVQLDSRRAQNSYCYAATPELHSKDIDLDLHNGMARMAASSAST
jgi:hypothetical protein